MQEELRELFVDELPPDRLLRSIEKQSRSDDYLRNNADRRGGSGNEVYYPRVDTANTMTAARTTGWGAGDSWVGADYQIEIRGTP
jgi:hypothetical protein